MLSSTTILLFIQQERQTTRTEPFHPFESCFSSSRMKCFHFTTGGGDDDLVSRKLSWARSLSVASTNLDSRRSEFDTESRRDWADSSELFQDFFTQGRTNRLRVFSFADLKSATRGFSRSLMIGEGGFGSVYRGRLKLADSHPEIDVAIKQLNRNGFQARLLTA